MSLDRYLQRLQRMDTLIRLRATGTPSVFAENLEVSVSTLHQYLEVMRGMGAMIAYSRREQTYYYETDQRLYLGYHAEPDG